MFQVGSWHYDKGGTDLFVKTISYWLAKQGNKIVVLVHRTEEEKCSDEDIKVGNGVIKVRYTPPQRKGVRFNPFVYAYRLFITSKYMYSLAKKEEIKSIVVGETELLATLPLKLTKVKILCRGGALMYETMSKEVFKERGRGIYSRFFVSLIKLYNNLTLKIPDVMIPVNSSEYEFMNRKKRKSARIFTIPHGVPINLFKPGKRKQKKKVIVGYTGRLAPIKYPEVALEIFKNASKNQESEFWWIGPLDPSFKKDHFEKLKKNIGIKNAKYFGKVDNNKLPEVLNKIDIFLQVEQQKNVSRSTTEAAACGLPIVALNKGKEKYGFFTMDRSKAVNELKRLLSDYKYRIQRGKDAREVIEKEFSEDIIYSKYLDLFKK